MNIFTLKNRKQYRIALNHLRLFLLLVAVPVLLILVFSGFLFRRQIINMIYLQQEAALEQYAAGIDTEIRGMSIIASSLIHNKTFANYTKEFLNPGSRRYLLLSEIERILNTNLLLSRELAGFYISFTDHSPPLVLRNYGGINLSASDIAALTETAGASPGLIVFPGTLSSALGGSGEPQTLSLAVAPPRDSAAGSGIETLIVSFVATGLMDFIRQRQWDANPSRYVSDSFLADRNGRVLMANDPDMAGRDIRDIEGEFKKSSIIMKASLETMGWTLMEAVNIRSLTRQVNRILYVLYAAISLIVLLFIRYNSFFFFRILSPLLEEIRNEHTERLKSEIEALRYRLNPHFLCNTLNAIRMMAIITKNNAIREMSSALMRLTEDTLSREDTVCSLEHELHNLDNYVYIMKVRYGDTFEFIKDVDASLLPLGVPSMILQPLVENAILHGFHGLPGGTSRAGEAAGRGQSTIVVSASAAEGVLIIEIKDNGRGMSEEVLAGIFNNEPGTQNGWSRIGLNNVRRRIMLTYGNSYTVRLASYPGEGTVVIMTLPVQDAGNHERAGNTGRGETQNDEYADH
jgi:two-component system sensor histidine kinase YesM